VLAATASLCLQTGHHPATHSWKGKDFMFRKLMALSLLTAALGCTSLHAQRIAYVPNFFNNTVSVINTTTNTVTATIPVGEEPGSVVFLPDGSRLCHQSFNLWHRNIHSD
jgi:YVTN family beta-propeller protein